MNYHAHDDNEDIAVHNKDNHSNHQHTLIAKQNNNAKTLKIILLMVLGFAIIEIFSGYMANSLALISDGFHMITDSFAIVIALIMANISNKPANQRFSFGYAKAEVLGGFINAIFMFGIIGYLFYESIMRIINPVENINGSLMLAIAFVGLVINCISLKLLHKDNHDNVNIKATMLHVMGDLLASIAAIVAAVIIKFTGYLMIDAILTILISILLMIPTFKLIKQTSMILMQSIPEQINFKEVGDCILHTSKDILNVHDLHIWHINYGHLSLTAHIKTKRKIDQNQLLSDIKKRLVEKFGIEHITIQIELEI